MILVPQSPSDQQRDQRIEPQEGGRSPCNGVIRTLGLRFDVQMRARLVKRHLGLPPLDEPFERLVRLDRKVSIEECFGGKLSLGIAHQHPPDGDRGQSAVLPHGGRRRDLNCTSPLAIPVVDLDLVLHGLWMSQDVGERRQTSALFCRRARCRGCRSGLVHTTRHPAANGSPP